MPAVKVRQENGSSITNFIYKGHKIIKGKPALEGLPATYVENEDEASTLILFLDDEPTGLSLSLSYTIFAGKGIIARSVQFVNNGRENLHLTTAMSMCLDLPDHDYEWMQFSGAWARERYLKVKLSIVCSKKGWQEDTGETESVLSSSITGKLHTWISMKKRF